MTPQSLEPGATLDHFRIIARVGQGGMGIVYRAVDIGLGRTVALKLLDASRLNSDDARARFHREAAAAAQLKHPHIATVYEFGVHREQPFIVLEWVQGETLHALLAREKKLPLAQALEIFQQIANALAYAHQRGVFHRDLKPSNILVTGADEKPPRAQATLVDFGLAGLAQDTDATLGGPFFGTPRYMAPEQIRGETCDGRADEYALALVLYEMLAGKPAFDAPTTAALFHQQLHALPPPLSEHRPDVPSHIERALNRALEKDPAARFPTVAGMCDALSAPRESTLRARRGARLPLVLSGIALGAAGCAFLALSNPFTAPATPTSTRVAQVTFSPAPTLETPTLAAETSTPAPTETASTPEPTPKPSPPPPVTPGGSWIMPGSNAAYTNTSTDMPSLNPTPRWQTEPQGAPVSSLVVGGGVVIAPVEDGIVRAFDWNDGALVWETNLGAPVGGAPALWLTPERGYVFIPTSDGELHTLNVANGKLVWRKKQAELQGRVVGNVTVNDDGTLYIATDSGYLHAIEPTMGTLYWTLDTFQSQGFVQPPTLANSAVLVATPNKIYALASTLEQAWQAELPSNLSAPLTALTNQGLVIAGTEQGRVSAYNILLGREIWQAQTVGAVNGFATDGWFVYATTREGMAYAWLAATGELTWSGKLDRAMIAPPSTGAGLVMFVTNDGRVRYFSPYTEFAELTAMNFQIQDTLTVPPALANGWVFARGDAVWSFGP